MPGTAAINPLPRFDIRPATTHASPTNTWQAPPAIDLGRLIDRVPTQLDRERVAKVIAGRRILITGAGGSIGSHLAHVAAEFGPEQIVLMERAENALFEVDRQLARRFPKLSRRAVLHDVVDAEETRRLLIDAAPHVVFHAAAHKHVPLMEDHPAHAVTNNLLGTRAIADAAIAAGAERFVMISSDKAVNPSSVMGATKRLAEMYVAWLARPGSPNDRTRMSMVRFGNVLGSACSVLTIWSSQIAEGGPITITDPRMTRYFMTIPEAAALVIASTTLDEHPSGAVYVLDMGEPIKIVELAERFVAAHGFAPRLVRQTRTDGPLSGQPEPTLIDLVSQAIDASPVRAHADPARPTLDITFTGARPGEKIHEELAYAAESLQPTTHRGITCWAGNGSGEPANPAEAVDVPAMMARFEQACAKRDHAGVLAALHEYVPALSRPKPK